MLSVCVGVVYPILLHRSTCILVLGSAQFDVIWCVSLVKSLGSSPPKPDAW